MLKILISIAIVALLSGCGSEQNVPATRETVKKCETISILGFSEGTDCFQDSSVYECPVPIVCVPDEESAVRMTQIIIENYQKNGFFLNYVPLWVDYDTDDEIWIVLYGEELIPGGGVSVAIRKSNAEIVGAFTGE